MVNLFVYGTLKKGKINHGRLVGCEKIANGILRGHEIRVDYAPLVRKTHHRDKEVHGEIYLIPEKEILDHIDAMEGHPRTYKREAVKVYILEKDLTIYCDCYIFQHEDIFQQASPVKDGKY